MISSSANVTAAIGVLKAAAMAAAAPTGNWFICLRRGIENIREMTFDSAAQICTVGPSRPRLAPEPTQSAEITALPAATRIGTLP